MLAPAFWKAVTVDDAALLEKVLALLRTERAAFCVIGGIAVNAYCEPIVTLDLDLVLATGELTRLEPLLRQRFQAERHPHSLNIHATGSDLRVQIQTDPRFAPFLDHAQLRRVLGYELPVAQPRDLMQAKIWAALDQRRRASKRQKDLADIARLREALPELDGMIPETLRARLL